MTWRKAFWCCTLGASLFLSAGGCAWLPSLPSPPLDQTAHSTFLVHDVGPSSEGVHRPEAERTCTANDLVPAPSRSDLVPTAVEQPPSPVDERQGLTLAGAIQVALAANPDMHSAAARLELAESVLARARAEFYPRL